ncbi:MAG TPA: tetratricopeptide repeat protein [Pyrinomonadaceae bacterium]|nr:tetratricopeptide repeat protein [Pyrinomonadaceae bacterium]
MEPLSALTIAGTFAWGIFQTAGGAVLESQSDKYFCDAVQQIKEKLSRNTPAENQHLTKAFRRSCLKAALQICARRSVATGGQSSLLGRVGNIFHGAAPAGLMAQHEAEWLKKAEAYLHTQIDELNRDIPYLPEHASEKYRTLVNPSGVSSRERAEQFRADLTDDAVAELRGAVGEEPPESFADEMQADWFSLVRNVFQEALSSNQTLANRFQNETLVEIVSGVDTIRLGVGEILSLLKNRETGDDNQPLAVFNLLNLAEKVYDRDEESAAILGELCGAVADERERFLLVTAPSGFGKSFLLTKVLQAVTDGRLIREEYRQSVSKILRVDCRTTQGVGGIVGDAGSLVGKSKALRLSYDLSREHDEPIAEWLNKHLFPALRQEGTAWLLLENFEAWLDAENGYAVKDASIRQFLNALFDGNHSLRVLFLSQDDPEPDVKRRLKKLERISEAIYQGLPEPDALAYLRAQGEDVGLHEADEELLKEFLRRIHYIPQALASLVGYLRSIEGYSFQEFMADEELWAGFDEYEGVADTDNKGIRRTKALIARQIERQSDDVKRLLCALAFFEQDVPKQALELLFDKKSDAAPAIARLTAHKLAATKTGPRGTTRYNLHAYFREQTAKHLLPQFATWLLANSGRYADKLCEVGIAAYEVTRYRLAIDLFLLTEMVARYLLATVKERAGDDNAVKQDAMTSVEKFLASALMMRGNSLFSLGQLRGALTAHDEAIALIKPLAESGKADFNDLAAPYVNKGSVLGSLGRLSEAIIEFDKATGIRASLVANGRGELAKDLANTYLNKGESLRRLGLLNEAVAEFDKAIDIHEPLVAGGRGELANDLALAYTNKGAALAQSGRLDKAIIEFDRAIAIGEPLAASGRGEAANALAVTYMNRGNALGSLGRLSEAITEFDRAIAIHEPLVAGGREELANDLATTYTNKGAVLSNMGRLDEAIAEYDKSMALYEPLVAEGREELVAELARVCSNKALVLGQQQKWDEALDYYNRSVQARERCVTQLGLFYLMPNLLKCFRLRINLLLRFERWAEIASDVAAALSLFVPYVQDEQIHDGLKHTAGGEVGGIIALLRELPPEQRAQVYAAAGKGAEGLRQLIEGQE